MSSQEIQRQTLLTEKEIDEKINHLARQIAEHTPAETPLAIVGIHTRGVPLANRIHAILSQKRGDILQGTLDIALYRDDLDNLGTIPSIRGSDIPFQAEGCHIVLVDDVLFTGRTTRAAIDAIADYGRPACIELAALIDRGHRELPIAANYLGLQVPTSTSDHISLRLRETDPDEPEGAYLLQKS